MEGNMMQQMIETVLSKVLPSSYPHIKRPAVMLAKITKATIGSTYCVYSLKILTPAQELDTTIPELPGVHSALSIEIGKTVAVVLPYGNLTPYILGEVV